MNNHDRDRIDNLIESVSTLNGKFVQASKDLDRRVGKIEDKAEEILKGVTKITNVCAARGVQVENAESTIKDIKEEISSKASKEDVSKLEVGMTQREKGALAGSYVLQVVIEFFRWFTK